MEIRLAPEQAGGGAVPFPQCIEGRHGAGNVALREQRFGGRGWDRACPPDGGCSIDWATRPVLLTTVHTTTATTAASGGAASNATMSR